MDKKSLKNLIPILVLVAVLIVAGVIGFIQEKVNQEKEALQSSEAPKKEAADKEKVAEKVVNFINENILQGRATASVKEIIEEGGLYKIKLEIEGEEFESYATLDGKILFPEAIDLEKALSAEQESEGVAGEPQEAPEDSGNTPEASSLEALAKCLTEKGMKFYGASWCGWCNRQKELFGEAAQYLPYVECIDEVTNQMTKECTEAGISGFPTWKLPNGELSPGYKELNQLAELSGCVLE